MRNTAFMTGAVLFLFIACENTPNGHQITGTTDAMLDDSSAADIDNWGEPTADGDAATGDVSVGSDVDMIPEGGDEKVVLMNKNSPFEGYTIYTPEEKRNNPAAGMPYYIYLHMNTEGVIVEGPTIDLSGIENVSQLFLLDETSGTEIINPQEYWAAGMRATINERFRFDIPIDDFEYEIALDSLWQIAAIRYGDQMRTFFIFLALGYSGVAHDITIKAIIDGNNISTAEPFTIEVR